MKKMIVCLLISMVLISGCTGSFQATKYIHDFHRSQKNQWLDEAVFLGCTLLPVYWFAMLGDGLFFNTIEFWTNKNPLSDVANNTPDKDITIERNTEGFVVKDKSGTVLYTSLKDSKGGVMVYNGDEVLVRYFPPEEVQLRKAQLSEDVY